MLNLLRSDFYRLFRSKSFYICSAIELAFFVLGVFIIKWASSITDASGATLENVLPAGGMVYGLTVFSGNTQMILGIIVAIFVTAEFSHGTMKNAVSKGFIKWKIYISKLIAMLAASYLVIFVSMVVGTIFGSIVFGGLGDFTGEFVAQMFKTIGIEVLLYAALTAFFVLICMVVRNLGGVLAIILLGVLNIEPLIYYILELLSKGEIKFSNYSLINNISFYNMNTVAGSDYLRSVIVALVYLAVTIALGILAFQKSDIK